MEQKKNTVNAVTEEQIHDLLVGAEIEVKTAFDKCTIVLCKLKNGFVLTAESACVDPANYDPEYGVNTCMMRIKEKLWELEGYCLQKQLFESKGK